MLAALIPLLLANLVVSALNSLLIRRTKAKKQSRPKQRSRADPNRANRQPNMAAAQLSSGFLAKSTSDEQFQEPGTLKVCTRHTHLSCCHHRLASLQPCIVCALHRWSRPRCCPKATSSALCLMAAAACLAGCSLRCVWAREPNNQPAALAGYRRHFSFVLGAVAADQLPSILALLEHWPLPSRLRHHAT